MLLPRCEGFLGPAFWLKLRKMKLEDVENFYVNFAEILHAYFDLQVSYRWVYFLNLHL